MSPYISVSAPTPVGSSGFSFSSAGNGSGEVGLGRIIEDDVVSFLSDNRGTIATVVNVGVCAFAATLVCLSVTAGAFLLRASQREQFFGTETLVDGTLTLTGVAAARLVTAPSSFALIGDDALLARNAVPVSFVAPLAPRTTRVVSGAVEGSTTALLGGACQLTANVC